MYVVSNTEANTEARKQARKMQKKISKQAIQSEIRKRLKRHLEKLLQVLGVTRSQICFMTACNFTNTSHHKSSCSFYQIANAMQEKLDHKNGNYFNVPDLDLYRLIRIFTSSQSRHGRLEEKLVAQLMLDSHALIF